MRITIVCLILLTLFNCSDKHSESRLNGEIQSILKAFNIKRNDCALYLFIPSNTCYGCRKHTMDVLKDAYRYNNKLKITIVTSDMSLMQNEVNTHAQTVFDKQKLIDRNTFLAEKITVYHQDTYCQFTVSNMDSVSFYIQSIVKNPNACF
ncbi:MAG: hypothetical protein Fur0023_05190 [Bacteroidia bacterium]